MEITEDAEENGAGKEDPQARSPDSNDDKRKSSVSEATAVPPRRALTDADGVSISDRTSRPSTRDHVDSPSDRRPSLPWDSSGRTPAQQHLLEHLSQPSEPRMSSQTTRPSLRDLEHSSSTRPKVKLGPRPSVDVNGRPRTAGSLARSHDQRPVAALPAGIKSSSRKANPTTSRPKSQPSSAASVHSLTRAPPVPPLLVPPPSLSVTRPQLSPSAKSTNSHSSPGMTPEKQRLMRALELRKKQMEKRAEEEKRKEQLQEQKSDTSLDADENKENIDTVHDKDIEEEHMQQQVELDSQHAAPSSLPAESHHTQKPSSDSSKPDSAVDMMAADSDSTQHSTSSTPAASDTSHTVSDGPLEGTQLPTSQADHKGDSEVSEAAVSVENNTDDPLVAGVESSTEKVGEGVAVPPAITLEVTTSENEEKTPTLATETSPQQERPRSARSSMSSLAASEDDDSASQAPDTTDQEDTEPKTKRKPLLEPIRVVPGHEVSDDDNLLSDDSFMEELKSATVQEAKPVSVGGKSPMSPEQSRAVSNPITGASDVQALPVGRSASSSYLDNNNKPVPVLVAKKVNVSSGISKRIKALEKFSHNSSSNTSHNLTVPTPSISAFDKFRKRASQITAPSDAPSPSPETPSKAPTPEPSDSVSSTSNARPKPNSVSVTARIVRDPNPPPADSKADPFEPGALNLQRSPLIVESGSPESPSDPLPSAVDKTEKTEKTEKAESAEKPEKPEKSEKPEKEEKPEKSEQRSMSVSSTGSRSNSLAAPGSESRLSTSSRSKAEGINRSPSTSDLASSPEEKKESRTSRLMRRMSSMTSNSRKSVLHAFSSSVKEEETPPPPPEKDDEPAPETPQAVDIGEVNVQFPDTLLWKRRFMRIDEQGYLVLTPGNVDSSTRNMIKRYHLSEFKTFSLPDADMQELPHSIVMDFLDGNTLQCACESRQGQTTVLQSKHTLLLI